MTPPPAAVAPAALSTAFGRHESRESDGSLDETYLAHNGSQLGTDDEYDEAAAALAAASAHEKRREPAAPAVSGLNVGGSSSGSVAPPTGSAATLASYTPNGSSGSGYAPSSAPRADHGAEAPREGASGGAAGGAAGGTAGGTAGCAAGGAAGGTAGGAARNPTVKYVDTLLGRANRDKISDEDAKQATGASRPPRGPTGSKTTRRHALTLRRLSCSTRS